ncbi:MAG: replicative DNA helicase [Myxococcota bacterium]
MLGALLRDPSLMGTHGDSLKPEDFFLEPHRHICEALQEVHGKGIPVDVVVLGEQLRKAKMLEAIGGPMFLGDLMAEVGTTVGLEHHVQIVQQKSMIRSMISAATEVATAGYAPDLDLMTFMDDAEQKVFAVLTGGRKKDIRPIKDVLVETMKILQEQQEAGTGMSGIPSGFDQLDKITMGLQKTDLIIMAGRPGMGKTSFALSLALHVAVQERRAVAVFSLEMGAEQLAMRLLSSEGHVNLKELRGGRPSMEDFRRLADAADRLSNSRIYIDDTPAVSLAEVRSRCRRLSLAGNLDLVVIDYLQLMSARSNTVSREQQISEISRGLKALAKELYIPVITLSQLNRSLESRQDKRPMLSDLRESGAIEQDADIIIFLYRDEYYHPDSEDKGVTEVIVGKQRNGPTDTARVAFIAKYAKFANLSPANEF